MIMQNCLASHHFVKCKHKYCKLNVLPVFSVNVLKSHDQL